MKKREREFFINEAGEDTIESFDRPEKVNTELLILVEKDRTIHLKNCKILKDIPDKEQKILGSRRYAKSKGYKPCKECGPF